MVLWAQYNIYAVIYTYVTFEYHFIVGFDILTVTSSCIVSDMACHYHYHIFPHVLSAVPPT